MNQGMYVKVKAYGALVVPANPAEEKKINIKLYKQKHYVCSATRVLLSNL